VFMDLPLSKLNIDWSYQDRPRDTLVRQIAEQFQPVMLGTFIVSERPDGGYWVCDGATRKLGLEAAGQQDRVVRCQVIQTNGRKQEALLFKYYNNARKQVPLANRLNAEGIAGVDRGLLKIVLKVGYKLVGSGKNTLKGIGFVKEAFDLDEGVSVEKALFAIKETWKNSTNRPDGNTILGIANVYYSQPQKRVDAQVRQVLKRLSPDTLDEKVRRAWGGGPKVGSRIRPNDRPPFVAQVIGQEINRHPGKAGKIDMKRLDELRSSNQ